MISRVEIATSPLRGIAAAALICIAVGLPLAVALTDPDESLKSMLSPAHASDGQIIAAPVAVSGRLPLVLESGVVLRGSDEPLPAGRLPPQVTVESAFATLDLSRPSQPAAGADLPSQLPTIAGLTSGTMRLRRAKLRLRAPALGEVDLDEVAATITVTRRGGYKLVGHGMAHDQRISIDATWSEPVGRDAGTALPIRLSLRGNLGELLVDGTLTPGVRSSFSGHSELKIPRLKKLVAWLGLGEMTGQHISSFSLSGPLEWTKSTLSFAKANVQLDDNQARGALAVRKMDGRLVLDGTFAFETLNLVRYMTSAPAAGKQAGSRLLEQFDADLRISAEDIEAGTLDLGRAALTLALKNGQIQADLAELEIEGGRAGGRLTLDLKTDEPKALIKAKLTAVDAGRLLANKLKSNAVIGRINVGLEGTLQGASIPAAMASLSGRGQVDLVEPGRLGVDVASLFHAARSGKVLAWSSASKNGMAVDSLTGRFRVLNGAVTIEQMQARSGGRIVAAAGQLDVPGHLLELTVGTAAAGAVPTGGDALAVASEVLLMRGTWESPNIEIQPTRRPDFKAEMPFRAH